MPVWLTEEEHEVLAAAADRLLPADPERGAPGGRALGVADYVDRLLGAFSFDPPRIWAGGPFSGRHGGQASFDDWLPLDRLDQIAWRRRLDELQVRYRAGLQALGDDFATCVDDEQDRRLGADPSFRALLYAHACEAAYGDPVYGGNRDGAGWAFIGFAGDVAPRGWTPAEVRGDEQAVELGLGQLDDLADERTTDAAGRGAPDGPSETEPGVGDGSAPR
ncbi:MAG: gluconate 2-dehydrogenase subunit 3 family protein [Acidimicrobiales bacterium]